MKSKKGQMEIMGLAIIVILISVAMLFTISFVVLKKPTAYKKEFTQTELASNMLSTMLKTTVPECNRMTIGELYEDCAKTCEGSNVCTDIMENSQSSCTYLNTNTADILAKTLEEWHIDYYFKAETSLCGDGPLIPPLGIECTGAKKHKEYALPIGASGQILFITLDICG